MLIISAKLTEVCLLACACECVCEGVRVRVCVYEPLGVCVIKLHYQVAKLEDQSQTPLLCC